MLTNNKITHTLALVAFTVFLAGAGSSYGQAFDSAAEYFEDASLKLAEQDSDAAVVQLKNALQLDAEHVPSLLLLGETLLLSDDSENAALLLTDAMLLGADQSKTIPLLIEAYHREGLHSQLLTQFDPNDIPAELRAEVFAARGQSYLSLGRINLAKKAIDRAFAIDQDNLRARFALLTYRIRRTEWAEALELAGQLVKDAPGDSRSYSGLASIQHASGMLEQAISGYEQALTLSPRNLDARIALISIFIDLDRDERAKEHLDYLYENFRYEPRSAYFWALHGARSGNADQEKEGLDTAIASLTQMPTDTVASNPQLLMIGALANFGLGNYQTTADYIDSYLALNGTDFGAQKLKAMNLLAVGDAFTAEQELAAMNRRQPGDPDVIALLATAYERQEQHQLAADLLLSLEGAGDGVLATDTQLGISLINAGRMATGIDTLEAVIAQTDDQNIKFALAVAYIRDGQIPAALELLDSLSRESPNDLSVQNLSAVALSQQGRTEEARQILNRTLAAEPEFLPARINLFRIALRDNDLETAQDELNEAIALAPESARVLYEQARLHFSADNYEEALRWAERASQGDRANSTYLKLELDLKLALGDLEGAETAARQAAAKNQYQPSFAALLGQTLVAVGKESQASLIYTQMVRAADFNTEVLYRIAILQSEIKQYDSAIYALSNALRGDSLHAPSRRANLRMHLLAGRYGDVIELANAFHRDFPNDANGWLAEAEAYLNLGKFESAAKAFAQAVELGARGEGTLGLYRSYMQNNKTDLAESIVVEYRRNGGTDLRVIAAQSDLLIHQQRWSDALEVLNEILARAPNSAPHLNNRALVRHELGDSLAASDARAAVALAPENASINDTLGWILVETGETSSALPYLREATTRNSDDPSMHYHLAAALASLGRRREALAALYVAIESDAPFSEIEDALQLQKELQ